MRESLEGGRELSRADLTLARSSGVLLHPTSLPGGRLGDEAHAFVDWLAAAGQSWWQVLPLGPPDEYGSPYAASSAFAASPGLLADPGAAVTTAELDDFAARHPHWIADYDAHAGAEAVSGQVRFEREWSALRDHAAEREVRLIGDLPLYVASGSIDVRAHPELFREDVVAGAPPDLLSEAGQLWGNPLYDWAAHRRQGYRWWIERLRRTLELVDAVRLDHFRGFVSYWAVPAGSETAMAGGWRRGPGRALFRAIEAELGPLALIAEDLGVITRDVYRLRDELGIPGIVVLQWGFGGSRANPHRPENHRERTVAYTGTHDTDTAVGWWRSLDARERAATGLDPAEPHWSLVRRTLGSPAAVSILLAQDLLGLGSGARMNTPGLVGGNWAWRLEPGQLTQELARRLREETEASGRLP